MHVDGASMPIAAQSIQTTEALRQRPDTARLRYEEVGVDVGADFEGLRRHYDKVSLAAGRRIAGRCNTGNGIENPLPRPFRFPFPCATRQEQDFGRFLVDRISQPAEDCPGGCRSVDEHDACRRIGRFFDQ